MTANDFREIALSLPEAVESEHMGHPDFRVRGKIFATLGPKDEWGMVKLMPKDQKRFVRTDVRAFEAFAGAWGRNGSTKVILMFASEPAVREALAAAWRNAAPKRLHDLLDNG